MKLNDSEIGEIFPKRAETAIVLGNGPSMDHFTVEFMLILAEKNPVVIGVNRIFAVQYNVFRPVHYYIATDRTCWREEPLALRQLSCLRYFAYNRYESAINAPRLVFFELNTNPFTISDTTKIAPGHGYTSMATATQLALMQGAKKIHFFGVDCALQKDGKTHTHGTMRRNNRQWENITRGTLNALEKLREKQISYTVHSDIFSYFDVKEYEAKQCHLTHTMVDGQE